MCDGQLLSTYFDIKESIHESSAAKRRVAFGFCRQGRGQKGDPSQRVRGVKSEHVSEQRGLVYMADEHVVGRQEYMTILC